MGAEAKAFLLSNLFHASNIYNRTPNVISPLLKAHNISLDTYPGIPQGLYCSAISTWLSPDRYLVFHPLKEILLQKTIKLAKRPLKPILSPIVDRSRIECGNKLWLQTDQNCLVGLAKHPSHSPQISHIRKTTQTIVTVKYRATYKLNRDY